MDVINRQGRGAIKFQNETGIVHVLEVYPSYAALNLSVDGCEVPVQLPLKLPLGAMQNSLVSVNIEDVPVNCDVELLIRREPMGHASPTESHRFLTFQTFQNLALSDSKVSRNIDFFTT
jgi:hypothetical protein